MIRRIALLLSGLLLATGSFAEPRPAAGVFLVAQRQLNDPNFARTVVLLTDYGPEGATGLIVNRRTPVDVREALPDLDGSADYEGKLYFGGPVRLGSFRALLRSRRRPGRADAVLPGVWASGRRDLVSKRLRKDGDDKLRLFAGYAGWSPGQLDAEIERGSWHLVEADADLVFSEHPARLWRQLAPPDPALRAELRSVEAQP